MKASDVMVRNVVTVHPETDIAEAVQLLTDYDISALPVVNQRCVRWQGLDRRHLKFIAREQWGDWNQERYLQPGDVLWNSTGTGTIGRACLYIPSELQSGMSGFSLNGPHVTAWTQENHTRFSSKMSDPHPAKFCPSQLFF